jgi:hypothetical protein
LSTLIVPGFPRHSMIHSTLRVTRLSGIRKSTSSPAFRG